ncbi:MAG: roadblock/LC7 domain-containing protein [Chitinivibrionales bacterium]|nr:roadblock/LC7 domain-containing protein [Chitinivibrionales bacterium]
MVLYERCVHQLNAILAQLVEKSEVVCAVLIGRDGQVITGCGDLQRFSITSLAALVAATYASTKTIAQMLGEEEFNTLFHQGKELHINITNVGEKAILATIFNNRCSLGVVKYFAEIYSPQLGTTLTNEADE